MTTIDLVENFVFGGRKGNASGGRLYISGDKLYNYGTCIAERKNGKIIVNITKYSPTTSKHQNRLIAILDRENIPYDTVDEIEIGVSHL